MSANDSDKPNSQDDGKDTGMSAKDPGKRRRALLIAIVVFVLAGAAWLLLWLFVFSHREKTDDAYVGGNQVGISAQVPGIVVGVFADDTQLRESRPGAGQARPDRCRCRLAQGAAARWPRPCARCASRPSPRPVPMRPWRPARRI